MVGGGKLVYCFSEWSFVNFTVLRNPSLTLEVESPEAGTGQVFPEDLMLFTQINVVALNAASKVSLRDKFVAMGLV